MKKNKELQYILSKNKLDFYLFLNKIVKDQSLTKEDKIRDMSFIASHALSWLRIYGSEEEAKWVTQIQTSLNSYNLD